MLCSLLAAILAASSAATTALAAPAATTLTCSEGNACLDISVSGYPDHVVAGVNFAYTITATNDGPAAAIKMVLDINVDGANFESLTPAAGWTCHTTTFDDVDALLVYCVVDLFSPAAGVGSSVFTLGVSATPPLSLPAAVFLHAGLSADNSPGDSESTITEVSDDAFSNGFESP